jgi:hypothetical protein
MSKVTFRRFTYRTIKVVPWYRIETISGKDTDGREYLECKRIPEGYCSESFGYKTPIANYGDGKDITILEIDSRIATVAKVCNVTENEAIELIKAEKDSIEDYDTRTGIATRIYIDLPVQR